MSKKIITNEIQDIGKNLIGGKLYHDMDKQINHALYRKFRINTYLNLRNKLEVQLFRQLYHQTKISP